MPTKIILDPGSCHMGKLDYAKELIRLAVDVGADAVNFQLFKNLPPNIELPYEWMPELIEYGGNYSGNKIEVFASVFNQEAYDFVKMIRIKSIKFAYRKHQTADNIITACHDFDTVYCSGDWNTEIYYETKKLFCIPQYPVPFIIDFENVFPKFDGFSDHTIGYKQTLEAIRQGATIIEKHFTLGNSHYINCPDHSFALKPWDLEKMIKAIRYMESGL